jgi:hypothetical protein
MSLTKVSQSMIVGSVISVMDFGAKNDNTDAAATTAAIQAAIDYAQANANVKCIVFPGGIYAVNATINIKGNFSDGLIIEGNKSVIQSSHDGIVFDCDSVNPTPAPAGRARLNFTDLTILGPGNVLSNVNSVGIRLYGANYALNNVNCSYFYVALLGEGCLISSFIQCCFEQSRYGIVFRYFDGFGVNDNHFYKCNFIICRFAIRYTDFSYGAVTFIGCEIEGNNLGVGNATDGVRICDFSGITDTAGEVTFIGCHFEQNDGQYNLYYDSTAGRHLNIIGCKMVPGENSGSIIYMENGELYVEGTHAAQTAGANIFLSATTTSAAVVGDTAGTITGTLTKLVRIRQGATSAGGVNAGASSAGMAAKGPSGVGAVVEGTYQFNNSSGTRLGYLSHNGAALDASAAYSISNGFGAVNFMRTGLQFEPGADNTYTLGSASFRWSEVYAGNGTINTSDERAKQQIEGIPQAWLDAWDDVDYVRFKFNDAVEKKGDGARWHIGLVAQRVKDAFEARGINPFEIGLLCYDEWQDVEMQKMVEDENGNFVIDEITNEPKTTSVVVKEAGNQYGIRYEQALALECAYLRSKLK